MPFTPKTWADGPSGGTPINAVELNRIEAGVVDAALDVKKIWVSLTPPANTTYLWMDIN